MFALYCCNWFMIISIYKPPLIISIMIEEQKELMKKKIEFFYTKGLAVHVKKKNGFIYNGNILEFALDLIILEDDKVGAMPIYFEEIFEVEKRREQNENKTIK